MLSESLTHASHGESKVVLGEANLNKFNSPQKTLAHLDGLMDAEQKINSPLKDFVKPDADGKFSFKLT